MPSSRKKRAAAVTAAAAMLALAACGGEPADDGKSASSGKLDTVTVQLDYQLRGNHGIFHIAKEMGYFEDEGIKVEDIATGTGSPDALRIVGTGKADFGFGDLPSLVTARSQNVPVKALAAVNQVSPLGMCSVKKRTELGTIDDLKGKTVGVHPAGSTFIFYQALLAANDMKRGDVEEVTVTPPYENYLVSGKVDAVVCYIDAEVPLLEDAAGGQGSLSILLGSDAGYNAYGSGLFTSDKMIKEKPDVVQRFTNAYLKAFDYVLKNPDKTADLLAKASPELAKKAPVFKRQLQADVDHTFTSDITDKQGLGAMDEARWKATIDILADQGVLKGEAPETKDVYDPAFAEKHHAGK
ncbi:ABC transporter substrate-binding protein [Streptomyces kebangsaanensis]|uniref:ABC transporter substrate-binding protein n=1 Tax=Streptomyces kebangsaanensis TaxID=864058 RepID=A0ABW6KP46_9ACTN